MELQVIQNKIYEIRGCRVMLDFDLAEMYRVETKNLNLSVKRNERRFPTDFMFQLTKEEWDVLRLQIETSKRGGRRYMPYVFTEQGVAMLSGLLNSDVAIEVNISIMRAFVSIRNHVLQQSELEDLWEAINDLSEDNRKEFDNIYLALSELAVKQDSLVEVKNKPRRPIGYQHYNKKE